MRRFPLAAVIALLSSTVASPASAAGIRGDDGTTYCPARDAYEVGRCGQTPGLPPAALGRQLTWTLAQLAGGARTLTPRQVRAHVEPSLLALPGMSAEDLVGAFSGTLAQFGALHFEGFSYPPRPYQALALARARNGDRIEIPISVSPISGRINSLAVAEATPVIVAHGRYSGLFDVDGRRLFLRCTGTGRPTVVFENGLTSDWYALQNRMSRLTRVCSYDPARQDGASSRSDGASAPRTGNDRVRDLHALLAAARVPGPYVLAGHSNGGLFSLMYASRFPSQVAGLVLIDGVHPAYHRRMFDALKPAIPPAQWPAVWRQFCALPPLQFDWEQMLICRAEAQARTQLASAPLKPMPLAVLSHGVPEGPPGPERDVAERVWRRSQRDLAALEPGSDHVVARCSGHDIQHSQPGLVAKEIAKVVDAVREGKSTLNRVP